MYFKSIFCFFLLICGCFFLNGCESLRCPDVPNGELVLSDNHNNKEKISNLVIIADTSSSMESCDTQYSCFNLSQYIIKNMASALPEKLNLNIAYLTFGHKDTLSKSPNLSHYSLNKFSKSEFTKAVNSISEPGGTSRLDLSMKDTVEMLKGKSGKTVVMVFTDGLDIKPEAYDYAKMIKNQADLSTCIYAMHTGISPEGEINLRKLSKTTDCGKFYKAGSLTDMTSIENLIFDAILEKTVDSDKDGIPDDLDKCPETPGNVKVNKDGCPVDSDKDGIPDDKDKCPNTSAGVKVDSNGCPVPKASEELTITKKGTWIYSNVQFDSGKVTINQSAAAALDKIVTVLEKNMAINLEIQGHTDNRGSKQFNTMLSQQRADSVKAYIVSKGISAKRLTSKGYGPEMPIVSNDTSKGRKSNRRVEFKPVQ